MRSLEKIELEIDMARSYVTDARRQLATCSVDAQSFLERYLRDSEALVTRLEKKRSELRSRISSHASA